MSCHHRAFTLLELLVVVSIIAILASLIFPVLRNARVRADQAVSIGNLRQWGTALNQSLADYNGEMPWEGLPLDLNSQGAADAWYNRLPKYMGLPSLTEMVQADPQDARKTLPAPGRKSVWTNPAVPLTAGTFLQPPSRFLFSYAMNYYLTIPGIRTMPVQRVERPAATVFMAEKGDDFPNCNPRYIQPYFGAGKRGKDGLPTMDPKNAANFLFLDGHVALVERSEYYDNMDDSRSLRRSPPDAAFTFIPFDGARN